MTSTARQHYAQANAATKPRVPHWIKGLIIVACIGLAGGLTGCGGGSADFHDAHGLAQPKSVTVLVVGDSTMTPVYVGERSTPDYVVELTGAKLTNIAVPGSNSCAADLAAIQSTHADIVTVNYGINDAGQLSAAQYAECMGRIADAVHVAGSVLVLVESNPVIGADRAAHAAAIQVREAQKMLLATERGIMYCRQPAISWSTDLIPDGVHPSTVAKKIIAGAIADCIRRSV